MTQKHVIAAVALFVLGLSVPTWAQDVIQVPAEVPLIWQAVDMAQSGDVVLVDAAAYEPPSGEPESVAITGKGISLLADGGVVTLRDLTVEYVPPGETALVRGVSTDALPAAPGVGTPGLSIRDNSGRVLVEDGVFRGSEGVGPCYWDPVCCGDPCCHDPCCFGDPGCPWDEGGLSPLPPEPEPWVGYLGAGVSIENSTWVVLLRCEAFGGEGGLVAASGLDVVTSGVAVYGSHLQAHGFASAAYIGAASQAHLAGCTLWTGPDGYDGDYALFIEPTATVTTRDNDYIPAPDAAGIYGSYVEYPGPHPSFWADSPAVAAEMLDLHYDLQDGDLAAVMASLAPDVVDLPGLEGLLLVGDPLLDPPLLLPVDGTLLSVRVPPLPGLLQALEVHLQLVTQSVSSGLTLGPVSTTTLLGGDLPVMALDCPPDVTVTCLADAVPALAGEPLASSTCGEVTVSHDDDLTVPDLVTRTWTASDACGNVMSCQQTITVADTTPPSLWCPPDVSVACGEPTDPAHTGQATATDNCGEVTISHADAGCVAHVTRTWTATDAAGNSTACEQLITTVEDIVLSCPPDMTVECGESTLPSATGQATATGACWDVTFTYDDEVDLAGCGSTRTISRTWTATDVCGHVLSSCVQTITVVDTTPPALVCPPDQTLACDAELPAPVTVPFFFVLLGGSVYEACPGAWSVLWLGDTDDGTGTITRRYRVEDACGNGSECEQVFTFDCP